MIATNPAVPWVSKDRFVRYFVEVPELAQVPLGYGQQPKCDYVEGSANRKFANVSSTPPAALNRKSSGHSPMNTV